MREDHFLKVFSGQARRGRDTGYALSWENCCIDLSKSITAIGIHTFGIVAILLFQMVLVILAMLFRLFVCCVRCVSCFQLHLYCIGNPE